MINGVSIPVLTPFKFFPADLTTGDGVNFQNIDNTELSQQEWEGVYHNEFSQPVARFWNDLTAGIDFQIQLDTSVLAFANLRAAIIDLDGNIEQVLTTDDFFTITGTLHQVVIVANELHMADGCYRIKLYENGGDDIYYSEVINIADTHEDCYPLEYSNFENDFGLIFDDGSSGTWRGKILIPLRMYEPVTEDEKEVYNNDVGELTTLRTIPKRIYNIETYPISTWFAEKLKLIFGYSDLILNKLVVNTDEINIEKIPETDKMELIGKVQLNEFTDYYLQDSAIDNFAELIVNPYWTASAGPPAWDIFTIDGKDITEANYRYLTGTVEASSNVIAAASGILFIYINITGTITDGELEVPTLGGTEVYDLVEGNNMIIVDVGIPVTTLQINSGFCDFSAICSVKKLN